MSDVEAWMDMYSGTQPSPSCVWMGFLGWQPRQFAELFLSPEKIKQDDSGQSGEDA